MDDDRRVFLERLDRLNRLFDFLLKAGLWIAGIGWIGVLIIAPALSIPVAYPGSLIVGGATALVVAVIGGFSLPMFEGLIERRGKPKPKRRLRQRISTVAREAVGLTGMLMLFGGISLALSGELFIMLGTTSGIIGLLGAAAVFYGLIFLWFLYYYWR